MRALPASGDYIRYVDDNAESDGTFNMTAIDSRFGANLDMGAVTGKVEVDFHDNDVLLRHAFVKLDLGNDMTLLAGQTSDVFSPLFPSTLNWFVGWNAGNVGHRSPQFRWEWAPEMGPVSVQAALSDPQDTEIAMPDIQARAGIKLTDAVMLGASIVIGKVDVGNNGTEEDIFGLAIDVNAKLNDKLAIKGEFYTGKNLVNYMGNINEPIANNAEIGGTGLWAAVVIKPTDALTVNAGFMFDSNDEDDIAATGGPNDRESNSCIFGNAIWHLNEKTDVGIEVSLWETEYEGDTTDYDNLRIQGSVIVKF